MALSSPIWLQRRKGGGFNPASIAGLQQYLLNKRLPEGSTVFDESTNRGDARAVQLGRCYNFDGTNDFVDYAPAGFAFLNNASVGFRVKFSFNSGSVVGVRRLLAKQITGTFKGFSIYTNGATLRIDLINTASTNQLSAAPTAFVPAAGTNYTVEMTYNGNKLASGISWVINGVAHGSTASVSNLSNNDIDSGSNFRLGADNGGSYFDGKLWGVQMWNDSNALQFFAKCDEQNGTVSYDSSGNARNGTITNATLGTFHGTQNVYSYQNEIGYSKPASVFIPRNEAIPTQDVTGETLQFTGRAPNNGLLKASGCSVVNGTTSYWNVPDNAIFDITNNLSVIIRGKNASGTTGYSQHLITKWNGTGNNREWVLAVDLSGKPYVALSSNGVAVAVYAANDAIVIDNETTYGFTFSSGTVKLYVNGVLVAGAVTTGSIPASIYNGTSPIAIGTVFSSGSVNWNGQLFDARICKDVVLTDAEMLAIHNGTDTTVGATLVAHFPIAETAGNIIYDVVSGSEGTGVNSPTRGTQNSYHYNINKGFSRYDHASLADILVPYSNAAAPLIITSPSGYTKITDNPAGIFHNGAETLIDFTGGVASPQAVINSWETAWAFNTARVNPEFDRTITLSGADYCMDRALAYETTLSGTDLTKVQNFTATRAL